MLGRLSAVTSLVVKWRQVLKVKYHQSNLVQISHSQQLGCGTYPWKTISHSLLLGKLWICARYDIPVVIDKLVITIHVLIPKFFKKGIGLSFPKEMFVFDHCELSQSLRVYRKSRCFRTQMRKNTAFVLVTIRLMGINQSRVDVELRRNHRERLRRVVWLCCVLWPLDWILEIRVIVGRLPCSIAKYLPVEDLILFLAPLWTV